jgi:hypothetical protein
MSFMDARWDIWVDQALTSVEVSHTNGTLLDLEENGVTDESIGDLLWLNLQVGTVFATLTSGVMIMAITSDSATFASSNVPLGGLGCTTYPLPATALSAGARFSICFPTWDLKKYLGIVWEPVSEAASGGTLSAWFGLEPLCKCKVQKYPS